MDFLYKLFPYNSLFQFDGNSLTAWSVVILVSIFLFYVFRLLNVIRRIRRKIEILSIDFSEELIKEDGLFTHVWNDYQASFIEFNGDKKTDEFSYVYFNEKNLISANTNLRLINSIPATLVGFGILGTFIGLTYGISNFQTSSTEQIKDSIETLLSGMGTAFVSSIYGMLLSLVFTFFEKVQINSLYNSIHTLCYNLDKSYKISKEDERNIELNRQQQILNDYFIFKDENGKEVKPGNVFRDIFIETRKQSLALQSFSTDLPNIIEAGFEQILNDYFVFKDDNGNEVKPGNVFRDIFNETRKQSIALQSFSTDLANIIEAGFEKILQDPDKKELQVLIIQLKESTDIMKVAIETEIQKLGDKFQDPATNMVEKILEGLKDALGNMMNDFNESVSGSAKEEIENLTKLLGQAGGSLNDFPNRLQEMTHNLHDNFRGLQDNVLEISKQTLVQSEESNRKMNEQVEQTTLLLSEKIGELQVGHEFLMTKQAENLKLSSELLNSFNFSIDRLNELSNQVNETVSNFSKAQRELNSAASKFTLITDNVLNSSNSFKEAQLKFSQHSKEFLENNASTIEEIQNSLKQAKELSNQYSTKFKIIEKGLQGIFQEINTGLEDYRETVSESIETYLSKYTEALTETTTSLAAASFKQEEILEEISNQLSKLSNGIS